MTITCGDCGTRNDDEAIFCRSRSCGTFLEWSGSAAWPGVDGTQNESDEGASPGTQVATAVQAPPREPGREYEPPEHADEDERQEELPPTVGQLVCSSCGSGNWPHVRFCRRCGAVLQGSAVAVPPSRLPGLLASILVVGWLVAIVVGVGAWLVYRPLGIVGAAVLVLGLFGLGVLVLRFKRSYRIEKDPLPAGQRKRPRNPFLGKGQMVSLDAWLKVLAGLVIVGAICIGGLWAWNSTIHPRVVSWYASSREALFPRFRSVPPAMIFYTWPNKCVAGVSARPGRQRKQVTPTSRAIPKRFKPLPARKNPAPKPCYPIKSTNSFAEAFDNDLNTFWLSPTPRNTNDRIVVRFPPQTSIAALTIYAGDPTGAQVVPQIIQMTFYGPAETVYYPPPVFYPAPKERDGTLKSSKKRLYWPVTAVREWTLRDTQAQQRFSTGDLTDIARVVITIRGNHPNANPKATQALTEVEFFDKY